MVDDTGSKGTDNKRPHERRLLKPGLLGGAAVGRQADSAPGGGDPLITEGSRTGTAILYMADWG